MPTLEEFQTAVGRTDRRKSAQAIHIGVMGIFGELGSLMSEFKKQAREGESYQSFDENLIEEAGDLLWYFTALGKDLGMPLHALISKAAGTDVRSEQSFSEAEALVKSALPPGHDPWLFAAGRAGELADLAQQGAKPQALVEKLVPAFLAFLGALRVSKISLSDAASANIEKSFSRFPDVQQNLPLYDDRPLSGDRKLMRDEKLPKKMSFDFEEVEIRNKKFVVQKVFTLKVGDPLTDNISEEDDYRFHDVFHLAYAAVLGWSPVLRALLKLKRKSIPEFDENEDGARAILIEEGISTYIFNHAKPHYFEGQSRVDYGLLKTVQGFTRGYEVQDQPFWAWEKAILRGYEVFRELKRTRRGRVDLDLAARDIRFVDLSKP